MAFATVLLVLLPWLPVAALAIAFVPLLVHPRADGRFVAEPGWTRATATACVVALPLYAFGAEWLSVPVWPLQGTWIALSVSGVVIPLAVGLSLAARRGVLWNGLAASVPVALFAHFATRLEPGVGVTGHGLVVVLLPAVALVVGIVGGVRPDRILATAMLSGPLGVLVGADLVRVDALVGAHRLVVFGGGGLHDLVTLVFLVPAAIDALRARQVERRKEGRTSHRMAFEPSRPSTGLLARRIFAHGIDLTTAGLLFVGWWAVDIHWGLGGDTRVMAWLVVQAPFIAPWATELLFGRTLGHMALGFRVTDTASGGAAPTISGFTRGLFRYLDVLLLYGPFWQSGRRVGDLAAGAAIVDPNPSASPANHVNQGDPEKTSMAW